MSAYTTPDLNAIFDPNDFKKGQNTLTQSQADNRYVRYPTAQGSETFQNLTIQGQTDLSGNTTTYERIFQRLTPSGYSNVAWREVNGRYALDKKKKPLLDPNVAGLKAISSWDLRTQAVADNLFTSVAWSPSLGVFCAVASSGTGNRFETSQDGINWVSRVPPVAGVSWTSIIWAEEISKFVVISNGSNVAYSSNGAVWSSTTVTSGSWETICWSPQLQLLVAVCGSSPSPIVMTSPDAITWTQQTASSTTWTGVVWSPELSLFVAVSSIITQIMTSPNGTSWTVTAGTPSFLRICWSPELNLFCGITTNTIGISSNGTSWTTYSVSGTWRSIVWARELGLFVAVSNSGGNNIAYSSDGITWTTISSGTPNAWNTLVWSSELGICCALSTNQINRVMTSNLKARPPTNYNVFDNAGIEAYNAIDSSGNWSLKLASATSSDSNILVGSSSGNTTIQGTPISLAGSFFIQNNNLTLPTAGLFVTPSVGQLGYQVSASGIQTSVLNGIWYNPCTVNLGPGVWYVTLNMVFYKFSSGTGNSMLRSTFYGISTLNNNADSVATSANNSNYGLNYPTNGWLFQASNTTQRLASSTYRIVTLTAASTPYYAVGRVIVAAASGDTFELAADMVATRIA